MFTRTLLAALATSLFVPSMSLFGQLSQQQGQGQAQGQQQNDVQQKLQQLQGELQTLNADIQQAQSEANKKPAVREALKDYSTTLTEQMKAIDPERSQMIDRREEIHNELIALNDGSQMNAEEQEEFQTLGEEFNAIRQDLQMVEAEANQSDEAQDAMAKYNENLIEAMSSADPEIMEKIERRQAASKEFSDLRNAIMQQD